MGQMTFTLSLMANAKADRVRAAGPSWFSKWGLLKHENLFFYVYT